MPKPAYPHTPTGDVVDHYHGTAVADPYRWLEDPDAPETRAWIDAQNELTESFLRDAPARAAVKARLERLWNYERFGAPIKKGDRWFYTRNDGLQDHNVLCWAESLDAEPTVLLDPNTWSEDGTTSLTIWSVSRDGSLICYGVSEAGSDWMTFRIRDVARNEDLPDVLEWVKFSGSSWTADGSGFFYGAYDAPEAGTEYRAELDRQKLFFHRIGTPQSEDLLIHEEPERPKLGFSGSVSEDGTTLFIQVWQGTDPKNAIFFKDLENDGPVIELLGDFDASWLVLGKEGSRVWLHTDLDAPKGRIVALDLNAPEHRDELIPEGEFPIEGARMAAGRIVVEYLEHASSVIRLFHPDGRLDRVLPLPGLGTAACAPARMDAEELFWTWTSFTSPTAVHRTVPKTGDSTLWKRPRVDVDPERFVTTQVFFESKDGTRIPMFLSRRKDVEPSGDVPVLLYGYGGFNISITPSFSLARLIWMELGGVYATANLRGGNEYGEDWHLAGTGKDKQNVFDDFIAAAEHLIESGWTRPDRLAIQGRSNGGLLVGACVTQRPELFGAGIAGVGVMDMLRFHRFTIGWAWVSDYGSSDDPELFPVLLGYSPYHNLRQGTEYPAVLITTGDHDDRVVPGHSYKFAARMQAAQAGKAPVLIRVETRAGHGAGTPTSLLIEQTADELAFLCRVLGMDVPEGFGAA